MQQAHLRLVGEGLLLGLHRRSRADVQRLGPGTQAAGSHGAGSLRQQRVGGAMPPQRSQAAAMQAARRASTQGRHASRGGGAHARRTHLRGMQQ